MIASKTGVESIVKAYPEVNLTIGTVDHELTAEGVVLPGLGDAGDRLFGTPLIEKEEEEEELMHHTKRRRGMSMEEKL